jgi:carboxylesterase
MPTIVMQSQHITAPLPLLLFHGLLSSPQEFGLIAHSLRSRGLAYEGVNVPGYTLANDPVSPRWQRWRDAACAVVDARGLPDEPVILGGLCMGGVLAAAAALERKQRIAGLVLISPTFTYDGWGLSPIRHFRRLAYWTGFDRFYSVAEREPYGVKSPKIRKWVVQEMAQRAQSAVGPARLPLRALREGERMMAEVRARLTELDCPLLVIHAREDEITRLTSVQALFSALPQQDKELVVLENSYHMVTIDNDRHEVAALLERFVKRISNGLVAPITVTGRIIAEPTQQAPDLGAQPIFHAT